MYGGNFYILGRESTILRISDFNVLFFGKSGKILYIFTYTHWTANITSMATLACAPD